MSVSASARKISKQQSLAITELERWFESELAKIKKKELDIMKRYDQKRSQLLQQRISKRIANF